MFYCIFKHRTFSLSPIARDKVFEVINQGIVVIDEDSAIIDANSYAINILEEYLCIKKPRRFKAGPSEYTVSGTEPSHRR